MMKAATPKKLWKDIGRTTTPFSRNIERSPSFDRCSLGHSKEIKGNPSLESSVKKKKEKQEINLEKYKPKIYNKKLQFNMSNIQIELKQVQEQQYHLIVKDKRMAKNNQIKQRQEEGNSKENSQAELLWELQKRQRNKRMEKNEKDKILDLGQKIKKLKTQYNIILRILKYHLQKYNNELEDNKKLVKDLFAQFSERFNKKQSENKKLSIQNYQLRKQLIALYDQIYQQNPNQNKMQMPNLHFTQTPKHYLKSNTSRNQSIYNTVSTTNIQSNSTQQTQDQYASKRNKFKRYIADKNKRQQLQHCLNIKNIESEDEYDDAKTRIQKQYQPIQTKEINRKCSNYGYYVTPKMNFIPEKLKFFKKIS